MRGWREQREQGGGESHSWWLERRRLAANDSAADQPQDTLKAFSLNTQTVLKPATLKNPLTSDYHAQTCRNLTQRQTRNNANDQYVRVSKDEFRHNWKVKAEMFWWVVVTVIMWCAGRTLGWVLSRHEVGSEKVLNELPAACRLLLNQEVANWKVLLISAIFFRLPVWMGLMKLGGQRRRQRIIKREAFCG